MILLIIAIWCASVCMTTKLSLPMTILQTKWQLYILSMMHHSIRMKCPSLGYDLQESAVQKSTYTGFHLEIVLRGGCGAKVVLWKMRGWSPSVCIYACVLYCQLSKLNNAKGGRDSVKGGKCPPSPASPKWNPVTCCGLFPITVDTTDTGTCMLMFKLIKKYYRTSW